MTIDQFINHMIQHKDYMIKHFANTEIGDDVSEAYETAIEVTMDVVYDKSNWDPVEDEDIIDAAPREFHETYASLLHDAWSAQMLRGVTDDAKQKVITHIFRQGSL